MKRTPREPREVTCYTHTRAAPASGEFDTRPGFYYVGMMDGPRPKFALGPFPTHLRAAGFVACVHDYCIEQDPRHHFDAFGVIRLPPDFILTKLPEPPINRVRPEWAPTDEDRAALPPHPAS